jgi:hypothetical protein
MAADAEDQIVTHVRQGLFFCITSGQGLTTDGARAMTGKLKGLTALVKSVAPLVVCNHCCIHGEALVTKCIPPDLQNTLNEVVKIVYHYQKLRTKYSPLQDSL